MKIEPQIYVKGSIDAVKFYVKAFNGTIGFHVKNEDGTFAHADIIVGDHAILALCENEELTANITGHPVMQFNIYDMGTEEAVLQAYNVLSEGAVKNDNRNGPEPLPWNRYCFSLIDKYHIFWWIAI